MYTFMYMLKIKLQSKVYRRKTALIVLDGFTILLTVVNLSEKKS